MPIKLIVTADEEITNQIIEATNSQTEVKTEAFWSLRPFNKKLEQFYDSFNNDEGCEHRLYYERRSKQYNAANTSVDNYKVISTATQVKCFLAMFLNEPHSTCRYYGEILTINNKKIFVDSHSFYPYYLSAYTFYRLEKFRRTAKIDQSCRHFKYQMLMVFRLLALPGLKIEVNLTNDKKNEKYFLEMQKILRDDQKVLNLFQDAKSIIDKVLEEYKDGKSRYSSPPERLKVFTADLIELIQKGSQNTPGSTNPTDRPILRNRQSDHYSK